MSDFGDILQSMVRKVPGARGAIFVDWEGEPVGQFSFNLPLLDFQIVGAQWGLVWTEVQAALHRAHLGQLQELVVDWVDGSVVVRQVTDHYYVVLLLAKGNLGTALRELDKSVATLRAEM